MEEPVLEKKISSKHQRKTIITDDFLLIRLLILIAASFAMLGYAHLLPTLLNDLFYNLEGYGKLLGRYSFLSMLFLQVVYIFGVKPEISGREKGPKGDTTYLFCYMLLTLLPFVTTLMFGLLQPFLIYLNSFLPTLVVLYLVTILPALILLELLVRWRFKAYCERIYNRWKR
ncbi:hypothetical protein [Aureispira sp. CCB-QB1]|uniref:hypothetical protein n=1 Tax=Aureispira sp. CCB-QB1 TaxID=1313421 RepID=UPI000697D800|nr:hypothetical protein [Aureispira sp. CCB-QB1]